MRKMAFVVALALTIGVTGTAMAQLEGPAGFETEMMDGPNQFIAEGPPGPATFEAAVPAPEEGPGAPPPEAVMLMANHRPGGGGFHHGFGVPGGFSNMNLTDDQLEKIYKSREAFQEKAGPKMLELRNQSHALRDAMMDAELDSKKILSIQSRINALTADIATLKVDQQLAVLSVFTPEQRKEMRHNFLQRAVGGGGPCGGPCPGGRGPGAHMMMRKHMMERKEEAK